MNVEAKTRRLSLSNILFYSLKTTRGLLEPTSDEGKVSEIKSSNPSQIIININQ